MAKGRERWLRAGAMAEGGSDGREHSSLEGERLGRTDRAGNVCLDFTRDLHARRKAAVDEQRVLQRLGRVRGGGRGEGAGETGHRQRAALRGVGRNADAREHPRGLVRDNGARSGRRRGGQKEKEEGRDVQGKTALECDAEGRRWGRGSARHGPGWRCAPAAAMQCT